MKKTFVFTAALVAVTAMLWGFASAAGARTPDMEIPLQERNLWTMLDRARASHMQIPVIEARGLMSWQENLLIVDVREPEEFRAGHIPGAVNIPRGFLEFKIGEVAKELSRPILVYCKEGLRSALAGGSLTRLGYVNVSNLAGGFEAWSLYENQMAGVSKSYFEAESPREFPKVFWE